MNAINVIQALRKGNVVAELDDEIRKATKRAVETAKAATVTLTLTIKPTSAEAAKLVDAPMLLDGKVTSKLPQLPAEPTLMFQDESGGLTQQVQQRREQAGLSLSLNPIAKSA